VADDFARAIAFLWPDEGGLVDDPADPGGVTNFGLSLRANPELGRSGIIALTAATAAAIYLRKWWTPYRYGLLAWPASGKLFDLAVNIGSEIACRMLQGACGDCGNLVAIDGLVGPLLAAAVQACDPQALHARWVELAELHYRLIEGHRPADARFLRGWIARADRWPLA
jgi:lysozyme family protein